MNRFHQSIWQRVCLKKKQYYTSLILFSESPYLNSEYKTIECVMYI